MRFIISILMIAVLAGIATWFLPWWMVAVCAFLVTLIAGLRPGRAFVAGFLAIALMWLVVILSKDIPNHHILATRMAGVFSLPGYPLFIVVNIIIGGLVGGLAGWSGGLMRKAFRSS